MSSSKLTFFFFIKKELKRKQFANIQRIAFFS